MRKNKKDGIQQATEHAEDKEGGGKSIWMSKTKMQINITKLEKISLN